MGSTAYMLKIHVELGGPKTPAGGGQPGMAGTRLTSAAEGALTRTSTNKMFVFLIPLLWKSIYTVQDDSAVIGSLEAPTKRRKFTI